MNNQSQIDRLTDEHLNQAVGGMDCNAATALAAALKSMAKVYDALGNPYMSNQLGGQALGVRQAGCT